MQHVAKNVDPELMLKIKPKFMVIIQSAELAWWNTYLALSI